MKKLLMLCALVLALLTAVFPASALESVESEITPAETAAPPFTYSDLTQDWYRPSVENYGYPEIFDSGDGKFNPNEPITRMELARLLHRALDININYLVATDIAEHFDDVKNDDPGASALYDMVTAGIFPSGGSFRPNDPVTREELIHYIIASLDYVTGGLYPVPMIMPPSFEDDADISDEFRNDIIIAQIFNFTQGRGDNRLYPKENATRAEAVVMTDRLMEKVRVFKPEVPVTFEAAENTDGSLTLVVTISNNSDSPVTISHTSGQKFDFKLFDAAGESLYTWSADKMFAQGLTTTVIESGDKAVFSEIIPSDVYQSIRDKVAYAQAEIVGTSEDFTIYPEGYFAYLEAWDDNTAPSDQAE